MRATKSNRLTVAETTFTERETVAGEKREYTYTSFTLTGWHKPPGAEKFLRIRQRFETRSEALTAKERLEIEAANVEGAIRPVNTRLTTAQIIEAENAYNRLGGRSLTDVVEWFITNYRPPQNEKALGTPEGEGTAAFAFLEERAKHVRPVFLGDYKRTLTDFCAAFPGKKVHEISTEDVQAFLGSRKTRKGEPIGNKRFNNMRGELHAFFGFCVTVPRKWVRENPVTPIPSFRIARMGLPEILTAEKVAEIMSYVETYDGWTEAESPSRLLGTILCDLPFRRPASRRAQGRDREACCIARAGPFGRSRSGGDSRHA